MASGVVPTPTAWRRSGARGCPVFLREGRARGRCLLVGGRRNSPRKVALLVHVYCAPLKVSARLGGPRSRKLYYERPPAFCFPMPPTTLYMAHIVLPARPFSQVVVTTPLNIKHSTFNPLSAFLRTVEKGGPLELKVAGPEVVIALYPTHTDVVAHPGRKTS